MSKRSTRRFFCEAGHRCGYCGRDLLESLDTFLGRRVGRLDVADGPRPRVPCCSTCAVLLRRTAPGSIEEGRRLIAANRAEVERNFAWLQAHGRDAIAGGLSDG